VPITEETRAKMKAAWVKRRDEQKLKAEYNEWLAQRVEKANGDTGVLQPGLSAVQSSDDGLSRDGDGLAVRVPGVSEPEGATETGIQASPQTRPRTRERGDGLQSATCPACGLFDWGTASIGLMESRLSFLGEQIKRGTTAINQRHSEQWESQKCSVCEQTPTKRAPNGRPVWFSDWPKTSPRTGVVKVFRTCSQNCFIGLSIKYPAAVGAAEMDW
jgi:hypothetical protein